MDKNAEKKNVNNNVENQEEQKQDKQKPAEETKPNVAVRCFRAVKSGIKQAWESPVATVIGTALGAGATIAIKAWIDHKRGCCDTEALPEPDDETADDNSYETEFTDNESPIDE